MFSFILRVPLSPPIKPKMSQYSSRDNKTNVAMIGKFKQFWQNALHDA
jgi:hypothetical protein